jgi:hypothetical protein
MDPTLVEVWLVLGVAVVGMGASVAVCHRCLMGDKAALERLWEGIRPLLRERCQLVDTLTKRVRGRSDIDAAFAEDIGYLLQMVDSTEDPYKHAAIQNGLVVVLQHRLEEYHSQPEFREALDISDAVNSISLVDSRLAPLRDRYNDRANRYNSRVKTFPFSLTAWAIRFKERSLFPMLIPWWSTDDAAFGGVSADEVKQVLETWRAPMVAPPRKRTDHKVKHDKGSGDTPK